MHLTLVQYDIRWEAPAANFDQVRRLLEKREVSGGLIVLPEMFANGFSLHADKIMESFGGPSESFLADLAEKHQSAIAGGWVLENPGSKPLNVVSIIDASGDVLCRYAKLHPFSFAKEHEHYAPGEGLFSCRYDGAVLTPLICYDLRFPEIFGIPAAETDLYVVPANWPCTRIAHWDALLQARAIENQAFVVGVNRVGLAKNLPHNGHSAVFAPTGERVAFAGETAGLTTVAIDLNLVAKVRTEFPVLQDRKMPALGGPPALVAHRYYRPVDQAEARS